LTELLLSLGCSFLGHRVYFCHRNIDCPSVRFSHSGLALTGQTNQTHLLNLNFCLVL